MGSDYFCFWEDIMDKIISCEFNIDTACVEVKYADGSMISVDCTLVEAEVARNMYESSELEWLVYNAPVEYVNLLLHGDVCEYLRNVTEYHPFENWYRIPEGYDVEKTEVSYEDGLLSIYIPKKVVKPVEKTTKKLLIK